MRLQDFEYELPRGLIAQQPAPRRDQSRLMVLNRQRRSLDHRLFSDLPQYLQEGDLLVVNETKVLPARLIGHKETGGKVKILLIRKTAEQTKSGSIERAKESEWECLVQNPGKLSPKTPVFFSDGLQGKFLGKNPSGLWRICLQSKGELMETLGRIGFAPLPPYIQRNGDEEMRARDLERYQTIFACKEGAIAAPTAGLHFTAELLDKVRKKRAGIFSLTLHVGIGTFLPVKEEEIEKHTLPPEFFELPLETAAAVNDTHTAGKKVIAVGTTVTRALESCIDENGKVQAKEGATGLFITPGFRFRAVDGLITNFHLPRSTLLMLVTAFGGQDFIFAAYREAVREKYRFFSYGDVMFIQ